METTRRIAAILMVTTAQVVPLLQAERLANMGNAQRWADLKSLSDAELIARYDAQSGSTVVGTQHYLDELRYREQSRIASSVERFTKQIWWLTLIITLATIVNVVLVILSIVLR